MVFEKKVAADRKRPLSARAAASETGQEDFVSFPEESKCLNSDQLKRLEQSFREWAAGSPRADVRQSRRRILLIFLLIRYTGAKLKEVLALDPFEDFDPNRQAVFFRGGGADDEPEQREAQISAALCREVQASLTDPDFRGTLHNLFAVDPAFVRRKFYERAGACGFPQRLGGPEMIRKARVVELMQGNLPLPAVQILLGHSPPGLTSAYVSFSEEEAREMTRFFLERESARKTSARNAFFGKIAAITRGDIQSRVELTTIDGQPITTVITNDSLERLGLKLGMLVTAEVKAPWVVLHQGPEAPGCSAENRFRGTITRRTRGRINTEYVVRLADGTELCALASTESRFCTGFEEGDEVWAAFTCFSVVLNVG